MALPPCGLYKTKAPVAGIPAGRLVYFHNHGDPGAGLYLPAGWELNRAQWQPRGHTLPDEADARHLAPLPAEGLYSVKEPFFCCERRCLEYTPRQLVQLGYDGEANALLFIPELTRGGLGFPERGQLLSPSNFDKLERLKVAVAAQNAPVQERFVH